MCMVYVVYGICWLYMVYVYLMYMHMCEDTRVAARGGCCASCRITLCLIPLFPASPTEHGARLTATKAAAILLPPPLPALMLQLFLWPCPAFFP